MRKCRITYLSKKKWKGYNLPIEYITHNYYDVSIYHTNQKIQIEIEKKAFDKPIKHTQEEYDFPDRLYADWWKNAKAYGVFKENELTADMVQSFNDYRTLGKKSL